MNWGSFKKGGSRDWRVGLTLLAVLAVALWFNARVMRGDHGPAMQEGARMFWGLR